MLHNAKGLIAALSLFPLGVAAQTEIELSFYGGAQNAPSSVVTVTGDSLILGGEPFRVN